MRRYISRAVDALAVFDLPESHTLKKGSAIFGIKKLEDRII
jgi:hypothetical protein